MWKPGKEETFLSQQWGFTLRKEEREYLPYKYSLTGRKLELMKRGQEDIEAWKKHFYIL